MLFSSFAYTIGFLTFRVLRKHFDDLVSQTIRYLVMAAAAVGALIGSKLLYWFEDPSALLAHWSPETIFGGKTIVGGLIGGLAAVEWVKHKLQFTGRTGDLFAVPLCIGIAIGRIGCFLTGLADKTYGYMTSLPWGIDFGDGIRRHPTQLYEIFFLMLLAGILLLLMRKPYGLGDIFKLFLVAYCSWRLLIGFLQPDPLFWALRSTQWACLLVLLYYSPDIKRWLT